MSDDIPELTEAHFARGMLRAQRARLIRGDFQSGEDVADLRRFVGLTPQEFAAALGVSVRTLQAWERGRRTPRGAALALLRVAARHPGVIRENLADAA